MNVKLFGKEPALVGAFLQSILAMLLGLGIVPGLTPETSALISVAGAAVFGTYTAFAVKQNLLPAVVAAFQALVAVGIGFGLGDVLAAHGFDANVLTGLVTSVLVGGLGLFLRGSADPKAGSPSDPVAIDLNVVTPEGFGATTDPETVFNGDDTL